MLGVFVVAAAVVELAGKFGGAPVLGCNFLLGASKYVVLLPVVDDRTSIFHYKASSNKYNHNGLIYLLHRPPLCGVGGLRAHHGALRRAHSRFSLM